MRLRAAIVATAVTAGATNAWPEMASDGGRVDTHMHLHPTGLDAVMGTKGEARGGGRRARGGSKPRGDLSADLAAAADGLVRRMDAADIETAIVVVVPSGRVDPERDYEAMRAAVGRHRGRLALVAGGAVLGEALLNTPAANATGRALQRFEERARALLDAGAQGFGEIIAYHLCMTERHSFKAVAADHPLFLKLADIAAEADVPIDLHMEAVEQPRPMPENLRRACSKNPERLDATVPALERLLRHNRDARIVWQHIGWDNVGQMTPALLDRLLGDHPNLFLALRVERRTDQVGGGGPMPNRIVDRDGRVRQEWSALLQSHPDRFVIGSDEFTGPSGEEPSMAASFKDTWAILSQLPASLAAAIGRDNATRIYRLSTR